jgi:hypothetical protein
MSVYFTLLQTFSYIVRLRVLKAAIMKILGYSARVVSLKYTDVSEVRTASIIRVVMEAVRTSETSVNSNETTQRCIPEDCILPVIPK